MSEKKETAFLKRCINSASIAFSMYSRLPAIPCDWTEENKQYVLCFFPWIGAVIGLLTLLWAKLAALLGLGGELKTAGLLVLPFFVTGGIHLDGFLDTNDALSSWRPMEKRLEILKDPHAGAFAIITGLLYFVLLYGVLDSMGAELLPLYACCFVISRSFSAFSVVSFKKASGNGTVAGFSKSARTRIIQGTSIWYLILSGTLMLLFHPLCALSALLAAALTFLWYHHKAMKYFGGINGDLAGYFLTLSELTMPLAMVLTEAILKLF